MRATLHNDRISFFLLFGRCQHPSTRRSAAEEVNLPLAGYLTQLFNWKLIILWVRSEYSQSKDEWSSLIPQTPLKFPQFYVKSEKKRKEDMQSQWFFQYFVVGFLQCSFWMETVHAQFISLGDGKRNGNVLTYRLEFRKRLHKNPCSSQRAKLQTGYWKTQRSNESATKQWPSLKRIRVLWG